MKSLDVCPCVSHVPASESFVLMPWGSNKWALTRIGFQISPDQDCFFKWVYPKMGYGMGFTVNDQFNWENDDKPSNLGLPFQNNHLTGFRDLSDATHRAELPREGMGPLAIFADILCWWAAKFKDENCYVNAAWWVCLQSARTSLHSLPKQFIAILPTKEL